MRKRGATDAPTVGAPAPSCVKRPDVGAAAGKHRPQLLACLARERALSNLPVEYCSRPSYDVLSVLRIGMIRGAPYRPFLLKDQV
jgi:hypothetical protein